MWNSLLCSFLFRPIQLFPAHLVHGLFTERSPEEKLSMEQICKRRLAMLKELSGLYEAQLKATLLELRLRHDTLHGGSQPAAGDESTAHSPHGNLEHLPLRCMAACMS